MLIGGDAELYADFRRYYGLDLDGAWYLGARRVADLAAGLPPGCRSMAKVDPSLSWDTQTWLLSKIEFDIRNFAYGIGGAKGDAPKQILPSGYQRETDKQAFTEEELARILSRPRVAV